jgi:glycosyltransferase involved in cell wall biosynthesis
MSDAADNGLPDLVVVVVARNEVERIPLCVSSLAGQDGPVRLRVLVSDNASDDGTGDAAMAAADGLDLALRRIEPLPPSGHFVSAGRWALAAETEAEHFAFLAGDDTWAPQFTAAALAALRRDPTAGMVFPTFVWEGDGPERHLSPLDLEQASAGARRRRGLTAPDGRELANLAYGVFRRDAFEDLVASWERGGEVFGSDFAAVWSTLGRHRPVRCPQAVGLRHVRSGADLLERVGLRRTDAAGVVATLRLYVRLNLRVNRLLAQAMARADVDAPPSWQVQLLRAPQWLWGGVRRFGTGRVGRA